MIVLLKVFLGPNNQSVVPLQAALQVDDTDPGGSRHRDFLLNNLSLNLRTVRPDRAMPSGRGSRDGQVDDEIDEYYA